MWCLKECEGRCIYILPGQKRSFGKSLSDIKLDDDSTISRLHAIISVKLNEENSESSCIIRDLSKYGTFVLRDGEKRKLSTDAEFTLKAEDTVQFGLKHNIFSMTRHSFATVTSNLSQEEVTKLKNIMTDIGGTVYENWQSSCTHLTVSSRIVFTSKLACALASAKMIVILSYWEAVKKAIKEDKELPKIENFLPTVKEEWLHADSELFLPKEERKTLFRGLSFVHFCTKQYFAYSSLITGAGGKSCVYPTKKPLTPRDLTAKNAIVIQQPVNDSSQYTQVVATDYPIIYRKLSALKRRMVYDSEIPLAILHCSIEKYCNPKFNFGTLFKSVTQKFSLHDALIVEDTLDVSISDKKEVEKMKKHQIIPETCSSQNDSTPKKVCLTSESKGKDLPETSEGNSDICNIIFVKNNKRPRVIPESCDSQYYSHTPKKIGLTSESKGKEVSETNKRDSDICNIIFVKNNKRPQVIPESCDSEYYSHTPKKVCFTSENKGKGVSETNKRDSDICNIISVKNNTQVIPETCDSPCYNETPKKARLTNENKARNISEINKTDSDICDVIFVKNNKQSRVIPETCNSLDKSIVSDTSSQERNKKLSIIPASCEKSNDFVVEKKQQIKNVLQENTKPQWKKNIVKTNDNLIFSKRDLQLEENTISKNDNKALGKNDSVLKKKNLIFEKNNLEENSTVSRNDEGTSESWKNSKKLRIVSIETINNNGNGNVYVERSKGKTSEKDCFIIEDLPSSPLKQQDSSQLHNSEDNRKKDERKKEKDKKEEKSQKTTVNWYKKYLGHGFTDEILRKDTPRGKRFAKASVPVPVTRLSANDFIF